MGGGDSKIGNSSAAGISDRHKLARLVVVGSFCTLGALVFALIWLANADDVAETAKNAFTAILPVLASWVGTVLAFYFSSASQERASASLDKVIGQSSATANASTVVSAKMLSLGAIVGLIELDKIEGGPKGVSIKDLRKAFETALPNGTKATRLVFVEKSVFKYIMHISTFNAFLVAHPSEDGTLADMLLDEETLRQISKLVVFVPATATLADAKEALDKVIGAQDIIVTATGNATEPMLGWLSNIDLTKALQVS